MLQPWWDRRKWLAILSCTVFLFVTLNVFQAAHSKSRTLNSTNVFKEVTKGAGIQWSGQTGNDSFSLAWLDFNRDGLADLWISPHGYRPDPDLKIPSLYLNQGGGQFRNIIDQIWPTGLDADTHGSSWADFDNDGDPDLLVSVGSELGTGTGGNLLLVNTAGKLELQNNARGLLYDLGRGRSPLWFDENRDGLLDALLLTSLRPDGLAPSAVFRQSPSGSFSNVSSSIGFKSPNPARSAQLVDLTGEGKLDLSVQGTYAYPLKTYDISKNPFKLLKGVVPVFQDYPADASKDFEPTKAPRDAAIADFNGDQHSDLFLPRSLDQQTESTLFKSSDKLVAEATLLLNKPGEIGISFKTSESFKVDFLDKNPPAPNEIWIGAQGKHPSTTFFTLSSTDPDVVGLKNHTPGSNRGIYLGYDPASQIWKVLFSSDLADRAGILVQAQKPLSNITPIGFKLPSLKSSALSPKLLTYKSASHVYIDSTADAGLSNRILGQYAVAGDFDNDMDVDLYVACSYADEDVSDILYRNKGNGTFTADSSALVLGSSIVKPQFTDFSSGPKVVVADYDNDGFLDLYVGDTTFKATQKTYLGSPPRLFHNLGNANHWLEINLQGTTSNRDGIGARILATAGGVVQLRENSGGMHQFSQNQARIHLGLGSNQTVETLVIQWPSGVVQTLTNIPADQILTVVEPSSTHAPKNQKIRRHK